MELALAAILLHDTGYLKKRGDTEGPGAKYTVIHVQRSAEFAAQLLEENGFPPADIKAVQNMISCTGVNAVLSVIPFQSEAGKNGRLCSGHGGSARARWRRTNLYIEKLPILYTEFAEAATTRRRNPTL